MDDTEDGVLDLVNDPELADLRELGIVSGHMSGVHDRDTAIRLARFAAKKIREYDASVDRITRP
jgi:hypothetical protein